MRAFTGSLYFELEKCLFARSKNPFSYLRMSFQSLASVGCGAWCFISSTILLPFFSRNMTHSSNMWHCITRRISRRVINKLLRPLFILLRGSFKFNKQCAEESWSFLFLKLRYYRNAPVKRAYSFVTFLENNQTNYTLLKNNNTQLLIIFICFFRKPCSINCVLYPIFV